MKKHMFTSLAILTLFSQNAYSDFNFQFSSQEMDHLSYEWQISHDPSFNDLVLEDKQTENSLTLSDEQFPRSDIYYIRARQVSGDCVDAWSLPLDFAIANSSSLEPAPLSSLNQGIAELIAPFALPPHHPAKTFLDKFFTKNPYLISKEYLEKAGFKCFKHSKTNNIIVAKHPALHGYVLKLFTDEQVEVNELENFIKRIQGAAVIRQAIAKFGYEKDFKVPNKWIYVLPSAASAAGRKQFVLVAQDMKILSSTKNNKRWRSAHAVNPKKLDMVYQILNEAGLYDSVYIDNMPFSTDGKIAFIDTEHYQKWPVPFSTLTQFLDSKIQPYWQKLISQQGPLQP